ncbi:unnamed protein product [Mytilus edulis]|uniref:Uncharacterized protein n=1 Tax=Mytilus edulis TaxID=6550 RepID=A0A8S3RDG9_MYTED|nr:unnamed protein product [Mytilus edulis]
MKAILKDVTKIVKGKELKQKTTTEILKSIKKNTPLHKKIMKDVKKLSKETHKNKIYLQENPSRKRRHCKICLGKIKFGQEKPKQKAAEKMVKKLVKAEVKKEKVFQKTKPSEKKQLMKAILKDVTKIVKGKELKKKTTTEILKSIKKHTFT